MDPTLLDRLKALSTCSISDALRNQLGDGRGCLTDMQMYSPTRLPATRVVGPVFTVKMVKVEDTNAPKPSAHFVDACPAGHVMLIQAPDGMATHNACWGGLLSTSAKARGIEGVVIDGRCRDIAEHNDLRFPVFARGTSTMGQRGFTRPSEIQSSLTIRPAPPHAHTAFPDTVVQPGDILVADLDGVVVIPSTLVEGVVIDAEADVARDEQILARLASGHGFAETMSACRP